MTSFHLGKISEEAATEVLKSRGFKILERNFHSRFGEIDIIAEKDNRIYFFEVRYRKEAPIFSITPTKTKRILKTIEYFFLKNSNLRSRDFDIGLVLFQKNLSDVQIITGISYEI